MNEETEITSDRLNELLTVAGSRSLILAAIGSDGTVVYLRIRPDINEQAIEDLAKQSLSAHKRRRKGDGTSSTKAT